MSEVKMKWVNAPLKDLISVNPRPKKDEYDDEMLVSFVPMKCVEKESGKFSPLEDRPVSKVKKGYTPFRDGDILFAKVTPCMENGKIAIVDGLTNGIGYGSTELYCFRPSDKLDQKFLFFFLLQHSFRREAEREMTGAVGLRRVPRKFIEDYRISYPKSLTEQRQIVQRIESLFSRLDAGVASLQHAKAQLQRYRQSVLTAACDGALTKQWRDAQKISRNDWILTTLGEVTSLVTSGSRGWAKYYADNGSIFIRAQNINKDELNLDRLAYVQLPKNTEGKRTQVFESDILVTITGANVTKSALVKHSLDEAFVSQHIALVRPSNKESANFLYHWMISPSHGRAILEKNAYGAGKPGLNLTHIRELSVELPSTSEQHQIVAEVESRTSSIDHLQTELDEQLVRATKLRQSILAQCFQMPHSND